MPSKRAWFHECRSERHGIFEALAIKIKERTGTCMAKGYSKVCGFVTTEVFIPHPSIASGQESASGFNECNLCAPTLDSPGDNWTTMQVIE